MGTRLHFAGTEVFGTRQRWWLHNIEYTKCTELFTSKCLILCYVNFTSINNFLKLKEEQPFDFETLLNCTVILKTKVNDCNYFFLCTNNTLKDTKEFLLAFQASVFQPCDYPPVLTSPTPRCEPLSNSLFLTQLCAQDQGWRGCLCKYLLN